MLQTRSYEMCRLSGNLIQWRKSLFDTFLVYNNKNKPMLRYKFGSVYNSYFVPKPTLRKENNRYLLCPNSYFAHGRFRNRTDFCTFLERPIIDLITLEVRLVQLQRLELEASIHCKFAMLQQCEQQVVNYMYMH